MVGPNKNSRPPEVKKTQHEAGEVPSVLNERSRLKRILPQDGFEAVSYAAILAALGGGAYLSSPLSSPREHEPAPKTAATVVDKAPESVPTPLPTRPEVGAKTPAWVLDDHLSLIENPRERHQSFWEEKIKEADLGGYSEPGKSFWVRGIQPDREKYNRPLIYFPRKSPFYQPDRKGEIKFDVWIHFHGAHILPQWKSMMDQTVFVLLDNPGLSGTYEKAFANPRVFSDMLEAIQKQAAKQLDREGVTPEIGQLGLSSFSGGYGAIQHILGEEKNRETTDAVVILDGMHTGYKGGYHPKRSDNELQTAALEPFLDFALEANKGEKLMVVTHSSVIPSRKGRPWAYSSSTHSANWLTWQLGGEPENVDIKEEDPLDLSRYQEYHHRGFHTIGFKGGRGADHSAQNWFIPRILEEWVKPDGFR